MSAGSGEYLRFDSVPATDVAGGSAAPRNDFWFRLLNHATLALAGICLVHGEAYFLPLLPWCLLPYLVLLVAAFRAEGRWVLPDAGANVLGMAIVVGMAAWIWFQPGGPGVLSGQEFYVRLVPYIGPFLMALMTVWLFRRRSAADFWYLQGMGLVQVALGCVLASSPLFGILMAVYLTSALGCLALHYITAPGTTGRPPSWQWLAGFVGRFSLVVAASSLVVFLITPRPQGPVWDPLQRFANQNPLSARWPPNGPNQGANLNNTTPVELSPDEAFTFRATDARGPKLDVSPNIRFRSLVLENYADGVWPYGDLVPNAYNGMTKENPANKDLLPDFGSGQYYINFDVDVRPDYAGGLVLAEPVRPGPPDRGRHVPVRLTDFSKPHAPLFFFQAHSGTLLPLPKLEWSRYHYRQVVPAGDSTLVTAEIWNGAQHYIRELTVHSLPRLEAWTTALVQQLSADGRYGLSSDVLQPNPERRDRYLVRQERWEAVSRALCQCLSSSGEYTYSLDQRRKDFSIDPIEDFLFNVKEGHCERYASALVLMLRTQGIPARLIKGYRGGESRRDGSYVVRKNMAHAWAEVLVPRPAGRSPVTSEGRKPKLDYQWLSLDPTPGIEATRQPSMVADWWKDKTSAGADMWQRLIVGYNARRQAEVLDVISPPSVLSVIALSLLLYVVPLVAGLGTIVGFMSLRLRRARQVLPGIAAVAACYARLLRILGRRGWLRRSAHQTPRELAARARTALAGHPDTAALADVPDSVVDLFYRVRFGQESPGPAEVIGLNARLDELARALGRSRKLLSGNAG
jgi:hypothetical protein